MINMFDTRIATIYKNYTEEMEKFSKEVDEKIEQVKVDREKVVMLNNLIEICDMLIVENKDEEENNVTKKIFDGIKYCIVTVITYILTKDVIVEIILKVLKTDIAMASMPSLATIVLTMIMFFLPQKIIKTNYSNRVRQASLRKIVLKSKLKQIEV